MTEMTHLTARSRRHRARASSATAIAVVDTGGRGIGVLVGDCAPVSIGAAA